MAQKHLSHTILRPSLSPFQILYWRPYALRRTLLILISKQDFCSHLGLGLDRQTMHVHGSGRLHPVMPETTCLGVCRPSNTKKPS
jgi:hypothetical protein